MRLSLKAFALSLSVSLIAACSSSQTGAVAESVTINLDGAAVVAQGSFSGRNDHVVTGTVQVVEVGDRAYLRLGDGFTLDGAPDPKVGFGTSGAYDEASTVSALRQNAGAQDYALPEGFQLGSLNEAYIWCEDFSVALGVAELRK